MKKLENKSYKKVPTFDQLMNPLFQALKNLGGSGTIEEINQKVFETEKIPDNILEVPHGEKGSSSEVEYRLAWARTYLKKFGILENSIRGVWAITSNGKNIDKVNSQEVVKTVREKDLKKKEISLEYKHSDFISEEGTEEPEENQDWIIKLRNVLSEMDPSGFERLVQRILPRIRLYPSRGNWSVRGWRNRWKRNCTYQRVSFFPCFISMQET